MTKTRTEDRPRFGQRGPQARLAFWPGLWYRKGSGIQVKRAHIISLCKWRESFYGAAERPCYECLDGEGASYPGRRSFSFVSESDVEVFVCLLRF